MRKTITKLCWLFALALLISCGNSKKTKTTSKAEAAVTKTENLNLEINKNEVADLLQYLSSNELEGRATGSEGIEKAAQKIEGIFKENNLKPYFETYRHNFETEGVEGFNIVGVLPGNDPQLKEEFIILGAHYDHIGIQDPIDGDSIANGANDNAAGTVAVVEMAKKFAAIDDNKRSIMFVLFSAEELGLVGAKKLAKRLKADDLDLYTLFNFEMIGVPMANKDYIGYLTGYENSNFAEKFNEYSEEKVLGFLPQAKEYQLFKRSDNYPFYEAFKVPAQSISTFDFTNYNYYHHVADEAEKLDIPHMVKVIKSVIPGIYKMANTPEKEIRMNEQ
ncbi:M20/M25/M40 family metallo-hydrolase [Salegentibacter echinorum]|nr:M20/M25/M40 family metallo-hydrolase [Salegentibacter echinorum]